MERELLKQGDKVVMHTCLESDGKNYGKIWTCKCDEFSRGKGAYKQDLIFLEGFSGSFATEFLQKVNVIDNKDLKKALQVLLYDQSNDSGDLEINDPDEIYIDNIVNMLIQKNGSTCPFKNYDCIGHCKVNNISCADGLNVDCNREFEDIWKDFIGINDKP